MLRYIAYVAIGALCFLVLWPAIRWVGRSIGEMIARAERPDFMESRKNEGGNDEPPPERTKK
jgi:hypothetical protein